MLGTPDWLLVLATTKVKACNDAVEESGRQSSCAREFHHKNHHSLTKPQNSNCRLFISRVWFTAMRRTPHRLQLACTTCTGPALYRVSRGLFSPAAPLRKLISKTPNRPVRFQLTIPASFSTSFLRSCRLLSQKSRQTFSFYAHDSCAHTQQSPTDDPSQCQPPPQRADAKRARGGAAARPDGPLWRAPQQDTSRPMTLSSLILSMASGGGGWCVRRNFKDLATSHSASPDQDWAAFFVSVVAP